MRRRWIVFVAGVLVGIAGLAMLFTHPADTIFWFLLFPASSLLMGAYLPSRPSPPPVEAVEPERDVSTFALILAVCAILAFGVFWVVFPPVIAFIARLVPDGLFPLPWFDDDGPAPIWARVALAAWWAMFTYRFYVKNRHVQNVAVAWDRPSRRT